MVHPRGGIVQRPIDNETYLPQSRAMRVLAVPILLALNGCVVGTLADTAVDVVTLPVKMASAGVDAVTTSQEEADRNRGRAIRKQEKREAKERRRAEKEQRRAEPEAGY